MALYGVGGGLQYYQDQYFATLAKSVDAQTLIYDESLTADDGTWPTLTPAPPSGQIGFKDGAYHISGTSGQIGYASPARVFGDGAVEVTARETGKKPGGPPDGVGLIVRVQARPADMVVFFVGSDGRWRLYHYTPDASPTNPWHFFAGGASASINTDDGAPNRLLLIMRGRLYLCYVNGTYLGSYFDELSDTLGSGAAGVFNNDGGTDAAFSDFAVFPARPFSSLLYV